MSPTVSSVEIKSDDTVEERAYVVLDDSVCTGPVAVYVSDVSVLVAEGSDIEVSDSV